MLGPRSKILKLPRPFRSSYFLEINAFLQFTTKKQRTCIGFEYLDAFRYNILYIRHKGDG